VRLDFTQAAFLVLASAAVAFVGNAIRDQPLPFGGSLDPPPPPEEGAGLPADSPETALAQWENGAIFLDVRPREEYDDERVSGAFSLDAGEFDRRYFEVVAPLGTDAPLFVYGAGPDSHLVRRISAKLMAFQHPHVGLAVCGLAGLRDVGVDVATGPDGSMP
jgi:hypothetical protein